MKSVKEERHDEAEIAELAAKMMEAHKTAATKAANQQAAAAVGTLASSTNANSIMNYLQRKPATNQTSQQQSQLTAQLQQPVLVEDSKPADDESLKGHFGWESFAGGKIHIPYIMRQAEKYCAVRIIEQKLLNKYLNYLHQDLYNCTCVCSYYITDVESRLLNEINFKHCDSIYGKEQFSMRDLIVRLSDAQKFFQFLDVCYKKLLMNCSTPNDKCGFIRINNESVVPYTVRDGQKMVPLFYFEGETDNLKLKADSLSGWDLSYLKFCCKVQGIRNELFASETVAVISLDDIKSYFPQGTIFEDYWPNKVVDSQLLVGSKSQNSVVHWTHPPPKQMSNPTPKPAPQQQQQQQQQLQQQQQQQQQHQKPQRSLPTGNSNGNSLHQQQAYHTSDLQAQQYLRSIQQSGLQSQSGLTAALSQAISNGWSSQMTQTQFDQVLRLTQAQAKQNQAGSRSYSGRQQQQQQQQMQNLLQNQLYNYTGAAMNMNNNGVSSNHSRNSSQAPPPLVRSSQAAAQLSNCVSGSSILRSNPTTNTTTTTSNPVTYKNHNPPPLPAPVPSIITKNNNPNNIVTITRCPTTATATASNNHGNSNYLTRIPASTTITPTAVANATAQYYKDMSLPSSLSIYPKNGGNGAGINPRSIVHSSSASPVTASPTRASPQSLYAKQPSISPASPMHNLLPAVLQQQIDELLLKQNYNMNGLSNQDILKGTLLSTYANYTKAQQQQLQQHLIASAQRSNNSQSYPIRNKSVITSRATMDVIDLSPSSTPRSSMSAAAAAAIQASSKRNLNGQYMNGNQSSRMQQSSSGSSGSSTRSMQQQQHLQDPNGRMLPMPDMSALNGPYGVAYKVQKTLIETSMVNCINMSPYAHSELLIPLSELRDTFYPSVSLDICKRVMNALEIVLYKGNKLQYQAYSEVGKTISENVPLVQVRDVITYLPQLNYMVRGHVQETNVANKRARIS